MKRAFTMVEIIFVIVVLGILAGIAIPKFSATRDDAIIAKAKATIATIKSGIASTKSANILMGNFVYPSDLNSSSTASTLFGNVVSGGGILPDSVNGWTMTNKIANTEEEFTLKIGSQTVATFTYYSSNGDFNCTSGIGDYCSKLTK